MLTQTCSAHMKKHRPFRRRKTFDLCLLSIVSHALNRSNDGDWLITFAPISDLPWYFDKVPCNLPSIWRTMVYSEYLSNLWINEWMDMVLGLKSIYGMLLLLYNQTPANLDFDTITNIRGGAVSETGSRFIWNPNPDSVSNTIIIIRGFCHQRCPFLKIILDRQNFTE